MTDILGERGPTRMVECISQRIRIGDFTDGGSASGYVDLKHKLPIGAIVLGWAAKIITGFKGSTTALMLVGISNDTDSYTGLAAGPSCFLPAAGGTPVVIGAKSTWDGTNGGLNTVLAAETTIRVTVTEDNDFTEVLVGEADIYVYYIQGVPDVLGRT